MSLSKLSFLFLLFLFSNLALTQQTHQVLVKCSDCKKRNRLEVLSISDSLQIHNKLNKIIIKNNLKGYAEASFDSLDLSGISKTAYFSRGKRFFWKSLILVDIESNDTTEYKKLRKSLFSFYGISGMAEKTLANLENTGYPFSKIYFETIEIENSKISGLVIVEKNKFYSIDSIINKGDVKISPYFLQNYTDLAVGYPYKEKPIKNLSKRAEELLFLEEAKPFEIIFKENSIDIYTYYKKKRANQFFGILGLLPNNETTGKLLLTGEVNLFLINSFHQGEWISFNWSKPENGSQKLLMGLDYPFIYKFPLGIKIDFDLFKKDSSYINISGKYGIKFKLPGKNFIHAFIKNESGSIISTTDFQNLTALPEFMDFRSSMIGFGFTGDNLDYYYNPKKGYEIKISAGGGQKKLRKNAQIPEILYDGLKMNSSTTEVLLETKFFLPISKTSTIKISNLSGIKINDLLFTNELFRLGGLRTIRGFDEESLNASSFAIFSIEPRYIFEKNSAFYVFADFGILEKNTNNSYSKDNPMGFGVGSDFETRSGIFSVSYGLGKQQGNPFLLRSAKIHFGYINRF